MLNNPQFKIVELIDKIKNIPFKGRSRQSIYYILDKNNITSKKVQFKKYPHSKQDYDNDCLLGKQIYF